MQELYGDSARGEEWAAVRLRVSDGRIVDADAAGVAQDLRGLTLLEAAAVGGEMLPVDALANALAPAVRATLGEQRVAVALSGGVDSAVALLRAGPDAVGVTLRLWMDPAGPDTERSCCSPSAVVAARRTCHDRGLPHVTLDLREEFRRAVVTPFIRGYARGETPNPCIRCNGGFRFAELLAFARRVGAPRLATGHYARIVEHRGRRLLARARDSRKDQSYMLARLDPRSLARVWFPLGEQTQGGDAGRGRGRGAGGGAAAREPGGVLPGGRRLPRVPRPARAAAQPGGILDEAGQRARHARRVLALHARPAARDRRLGGRAALRAHNRCAGEHRHRRPAELAGTDTCLGPRAPVHRRRAGGGEAPLSLAGGCRDGRADALPGSVCSSTSRLSASPAARPPSCTTETSSSAPGW